MKAKFGIERETLRVTSEGKLAQTNHPFKEAELSRDFCESQLEIITPVCDSIDAVMKRLCELDKKAKEKLEEEYLWLYSNPPRIHSENEILIAKYEGEQVEKHLYRVKLDRRYGKKQMLYCGIHFNLSFPCEDGRKDMFYMKMLKYATRYSWLLTLLTAASPIYDASFDDFKKSGSTFADYASLRNSDRGYWNQFVPVLDYSDLQAYCNSIKRYIEKGVLFSAGELYVPVRIKSSGANSLERLRQGIDHIELRMFDLNPLFENGIAKEDLEFAYYLLCYFQSLNDFEFTSDMQEMAFFNHKNAARYDITRISVDGVNIRNRAIAILEEMSEYFGGDEDALKSIQVQKEKLEPGKRYAERIYNQYKEQYQEKLLQQMKMR